MGSIGILHNFPKKWIHFPFSLWTSSSSSSSSFSSHLQFINISFWYIKTHTRALRYHITIMTKESFCKCFFILKMLWHNIFYIILLILFQHTRHISSRFFTQVCTFHMKIPEWNEGDTNWNPYLLFYYYNININELKYFPNIFFI